MTVRHILQCDWCGMGEREPESWISLITRESTTAEKTIEDLCPTCVKALAAIRAARRQQIQVPVEPPVEEKS